MNSSAPKPDNLRQRAITGSLWYGGTRWVIQGLSWIVTVLVARILSPSDYGLFGFAVLVTGFVDMINELGLGAAIIQRRDLQDEELETVFWLSLTGSLLIYAVVWFSAPWIALFFNQDQLVLVLRVIMVSFFIASLRIVSWNLLTKDVDFKHRSLAEVAGNVGSMATTLGLAYTGWGVWSLVAGILCRQAVVTVQCLRLRPWWPRGRFSRAAINKVFGFGLNVSASRVAWYLYSNADFLVVGKLLGQKMLGYYTMVFQLATIPADRITTIINQVAFPVYSELQDQPERFKRYFLKTVTLVSLMSFPLMAGVLATADVAIPVLLTSKWQPIILPLQVMCGVGMVISVSTLVGPAVMAKGRPDLAVKYNLLCLVIMPVGFIIGTRFGIVGVCWVWLILFPVLAVVWYLMTRKLIGFAWSEFFVALKPATLCTVVMLMAVFAVRLVADKLPAKQLQLMALIATGVASYLSVFATAFRSQMTEFKLLLARKLPTPA